MSLIITHEITRAYESYLNEAIDHDFQGSPIHRRMTYPFIGQDGIGLCDFAAGYQSALAALEAEAVQKEPVAWIEWDLELDEGDPDSIMAQQTKPDVCTDGWDWKPLFFATSQQSAPEIDRLRASNAELLTELQAIANANPKNWDAPLNDTASFQAWAQSRARAAIAKAEQS